MPKCDQCGKKFQTISALNDHYRAVHPNKRFVPPATSTGRNLMVGLIIVVIAIAAVAGVAVYLQYTQPTSSTTTNTLINSILSTPISTALYNNLTGVSSSTLSAIGSGSATGLTHVSGSVLTSNGLPEVLYIGGEYCPYCAAERWSMVVALSKFGTFQNLSYMLSAADDQNLSTITFYKSSYTSTHISFVPVELYDRSSPTHVPLQTPTQEETNLMSQYDSGGSIPFVDLANQYTLVGSQFTPGVLSGLSWTQIGSQLNNPNSAVAKSIDGAANILITAICKIDGGQPSSVCGQSFANLSIMIPDPNFSPSSPFLAVVSSNEIDVRV